MVEDARPNLLKAWDVGGEGGRLVVDAGGLCGCGSKLNKRGYAGFGPCFHLPGFHFGTGFLSHSHMAGLSFVVHALCDDPGSIAPLVHRVSLGLVGNLQINMEPSCADEPPFSLPEFLGLIRFDKDQFSGIYRNIYKYIYIYIHRHFFDFHVDLTRSSTSRAFACGSSGSKLAA